MNRPADLRDALRQLSGIRDKTSKRPQDGAPVVPGPPAVAVLGQSVVFRSHGGGAVAIVLAIMSLPIGLECLFFGVRDLLTGTAVVGWLLLLVAGLAALSISVATFTKRKQLLGVGSAFAADRRGVWYRTGKSELQYLPWSRIAWFTTETSGRYCYLLFGSANRPLPGAYRTTGWIRVQATASPWGIADTMPVRAALPVLYALSGGRVHIR